MHVHTSALQAVLIFAMVLLIGTVWRVVSAHKSESAVGKAMAFMY